MAKKEETILDYLAKGKEEKYVGESMWSDKVEMVRITTDNGVYEFPATQLDKYNQAYDTREDLLKRWNADRRQSNNNQKWGTYASHPSRVNDNYLGGKDFDQHLLYLSQHRESAATYYAIYHEACKAPMHIAKYVYENLLSQLRRDKMQGISKDIAFDTIERMPLAFRKGWENVDLFGWDGRSVAEDLEPASGYEIGRKVFVRTGRDDRTPGEIIGYSYRCGKNGLYHIMYDVKTDSWSSVGLPYKMNEIHFSQYAA